MKIYFDWNDFYLNIRHSNGVGHFDGRDFDYYHDDVTNDSDHLANLIDRSADYVVIMFQSAQKTFQVLHHCAVNHDDGMVYGLHGVSEEPSIKQIPLADLASPMALRKTRDLRIPGHEEFVDAVSAEAFQSLKGPANGLLLSELGDSPKVLFIHPQTSLFL